MLIHVGNLPPQVTESDLRRAFETYGRVLDVLSIRTAPRGGPDRESLIDMPDPWEAENAVASLHLRRIAGRAWTVEQPLPPRETQADFSDFARS